MHILKLVVQPLNMGCYRVACDMCHMSWQYVPRRHAVHSSIGCACTSYSFNVPRRHGVHSNRPRAWTSFFYRSLIHLSLATSLVYYTLFILSTTFFIFFCSFFRQRVALFSDYSVLHAFHFVNYFFLFFLQFFSLACSAVFCYIVTGKQIGRAHV